MLNFDTLYKHGYSSKYADSLPYMGRRKEQTWKLDQELNKTW